MRHTKSGVAFWKICKFRCNLRYSVFTQLVSIYFEHVSRRSRRISFTNRKTRKCGLLLRFKPRIFRKPRDRKREKNDYLSSITQRENVICKNFTGVLVTY